MNPVNEGCFKDPSSNRGYVHDAQCINYDGPDNRYEGREICFGYNEDMVVIMDVTNKDDIQVVSTLEYQNPGYVHQGWLTEDRKQIMINDETDSGPLRIIVADVADLRNPRVLNYFESDNNAIDHNLFVKGNYMYHAQYSFGLAIYNLDDVANGNLDRVAHFDTYKNNDSHSFVGAWSTYPYFRDGKVLISSIGEGLFVVKPNLDDDDDDNGNDDDNDDDYEYYYYYYDANDDTSPLEPTRSPTKTPTRSPVSAPTPPVADDDDDYEYYYYYYDANDDTSPLEPSQSPTKTPTRSPVSPPTPPIANPTSAPTRDTGNGALPLSWNITLTSAETDNNGTEPAIIVKYHISNRFHRNKVFKDDCKTEIKDLFDLTTTASDSEEKGFLNLDVSLGVDQDKIEDSDIWTGSDVGGSFRFCLATSLHRNPTSDEIVTNKKSIFHVQVSNVASFELYDIAITIPDVEESDLEINYQGQVNSFLCDPDTLDPIDDAPPLGPFDVVNICVMVEATGTEDPPAVAGFQDLTIKQQTSSIAFFAVENGDIDESNIDLVVLDCERQYMCLARVQLINAFFSGPEAYSLDAYGIVTLGPRSPARRLKNLSLRGIGDQRSLEEEEEKGQFSLKIRLTQPCDSKTSSTLKVLSRLIAD